MKLSNNKFIKVSTACRLLGLWAILISTSVANAQQTVLDYSVLPETAGSAPKVIPNVMMIFDNSTSMRQYIGGGDYEDPDDPLTRSHIMRTAMVDVLAGLEGKINLGLMIYDTTGNSNNNGYGAGELMESIKPFTGNHVTRMGERLAVEDNNATSLTIPTRPISDPTFTSIEGSLLNALDYFNSNLHHSRNGTGEAIQYPVEDPDCPVPDFVILVTDGLPTRAPGSNTQHENDCSGSTSAGNPRVACSVEAAADLFNADIPTYVIGIAGVAPASDGTIDDIAGAGGTGHLAPGSSSDNPKAFTADSGSELTKAFDAIFADILVTTGSSAGLSIVPATSEAAAGSIVHSLYVPTIESNDPSSDDFVSWTGTLNAYFLDKFGFIREDGDNDGVLDDDFNVDPAIEVYFDDTVNLVYARRFDDKLDVVGNNPYEEDIELEELDPIWSADKVLSVMAETPEHNGQNVFGLVQRPYDQIASPATGYRHIFTWLSDSPLTTTSSAIPDADFSGQKVDFIYTKTDYAPSDMTDEEHRMLQLVDAHNDPQDLQESTEIVRFIRGDESISTDSTLVEQQCQHDGGAVYPFCENPSNDDELWAVENGEDCIGQDRCEDYRYRRCFLFFCRWIDVTRDVVNVSTTTQAVADFRNRSINGRTYLLGDIIHSTPAQVGKPSFASEITNTDIINRRRMVYVGANDGMLHAFNAGFWDQDNQRFVKSIPSNTSDAVEHELGAEIWAYAPMNLLPHLKFLADKDYDTGLHVSFMDSPPKVFDVQIWPQSGDADHPNGWGTILVAGMRLGGGQYEVDVSDRNGNNTETHIMQSAYVVIDITDPGKPPVVLGEITHPNMGLTISEPTVVKEGNDWFLVMGSGPTHLQTATSNQEARLFRWKLNGTRGFDANYDGSSTIAGLSNSFVGHLAAKDWDGDGEEDAVYFGTIESTDLDNDGEFRNTHGTMERYRVTDGSIETMVDVNRPVVDRPLLTTREGKYWANFGTAVYLVPSDNYNSEHNAMYGVYEPSPPGELPAILTNSFLPTIAIGELADVTGVTTDPDGNLSPSVEGQDTFDDLQDHILDETDANSLFGWVSRFDVQDPAIQSSATPANYENLLFYSGYEPSPEDPTACAGIETGISVIYGVDLTTGTAAFGTDFTGPFGLDENGDIATEFTPEGGNPIKGKIIDIEILIVDDPENEGEQKVKGIFANFDGSIGDFDPEVPVSTIDFGRRSWIELDIE